MGLLTDQHVYTHDTPRKRRSKSRRMTARGVRRSCTDITCKQRQWLSFLVVMSTKGWTGITDLARITFCATVMATSSRLATSTFWSQAVPRRRAAPTRPRPRQSVLGAKADLPGRDARDLRPTTERQWTPQPKIALRMRLLWERIPYRCHGKLMALPSTVHTPRELLWAPLQVCPLRSRREVRVRPPRPACSPPRHDK